jgi:D-glycero-alpha-D-manno-heptose 1-phosphate guanylyltransferase
VADRGRLAGLKRGMEFEAIVLAGGLGTRLRSLVSDRPKVMFEIGNRPFLEILLERMIPRGLRRAILTTGHLHPIIESYFGTQYRSVKIDYAVENQPLGTGGAVWKALQVASQEDVLVFNGDTLFDIDLSEFHRFHKETRADASIALKPMRNFDRYGTVELTNGRIRAFCEKRPTEEALINGGVYILNKPSMARLAMPERFSIETDFFEKYTTSFRICGYVSDAYFIDIGIPEDCERAQRELGAVSPK